MLEWILFSGKEGQKYFLSLALNNDKKTYMKTNTRLLIRETEIRSIVLKSLIKKDLFKEFFFSFSILLFTFYLHYGIHYPSLN